jgi:hypothetical protein
VTADQQRELENYAIACPLGQLEDADMLAFVATLIQDHDHLREKLMGEPNPAKRRSKFECMRPHLRFTPNSVQDYELAEQAKRCGVQPIYKEQEYAEKQRIWMPPSFIHEVPR